MAQPHQDIKYPENIERSASPASSLSSGYGQAVGDFPIRDDGLPEVAPDTSPEALSPLEVDYKRKYLEHDAPQTAIHPEDDTHKIVVPAEYDSEALCPQMAMTSTAASDVQLERKFDNDPEGGDSFVPKEPTILGIRRKPFFTIVVILLVIVAAAIGGGVGGGIAVSKHTSSSHDSDQVSISFSSLPTTTISHTTTPTRSAVPIPTFLNNQTVPDDYKPAFQAFSNVNYLGKASKAIVEEGGMDFDFEIRSYVWLPRITNCCVTFCRNATAEGMIGWRCPSRNQTGATETFKRIFIWCMDDHSQANAVCI